MSFEVNDMRLCDVPMNKENAKNILMAVACCSLSELSCGDCPLYEEDGRCRPWTNEEVVEAVRFLKDGEG